MMAVWRAIVSRLRTLAKCSGPIAANRPKTRPQTDQRPQPPQQNLPIINTLFKAPLRIQNGIHANLRS